MVPEGTLKAIRPIARSSIRKRGNKLGKLKSYTYGSNYLHKIKLSMLSRCATMVVFSVKPLSQKSLATYSLSYKENTL